MPLDRECDLDLRDLFVEQKIWTSSIPLGCCQFVLLLTLQQSEVIFNRPDLAILVMSGPLLAPYNVSDDETLMFKMLIENNNW